MSESAGRVLMIPKGTYSPTTTYDPLDAVKYEQNSYVCKQTSRGNLPTNTTYWQPLTDVTADENPTEDSTNLVQSGGVYSALRTINQTLTKYVNEYGSKNLCPYEDTWSVPTTNTAGRLLASVELKAGDKITFVCTQNNAMTSNVRNTLIIDNPSGVRSVQSASTNNHLSAGLHVMEYTATENGVHKFGIWANTISTATTYSKFMVCYTDVYNLDSTYEPYSKTNRQLTKDSVTWDDLSEVGAVNLLNHNAYDTVQNGITFTVNPDRSVTANGTATAEEWMEIAQNVVVSESARLSGCPKGGTPSTYFISINVDGVYYRDYGDGVIIPSGTILSVYLVVKPNATVNNIVFKPMIAPVSYNGPYVPYAKTNKELTEDASSLLQTLKNGELLSFLKIRDVVMNTYWTDNATPSDFTQLTTTQVTDMVQAMLDTFKKLGGAKDTVYFGRLKCRNLKANGDVLSEAIYTPFLVAARETYYQMLSQTTEQGTNAGVITIAYLNIGSSSITLISKWGNDVRYEVIGSSSVTAIYHGYTRITTYKG